MRRGVWGREASPDPGVQTTRRDRYLLRPGPDRTGRGRCRAATRPAPPRRRRRGRRRGVERRRLDESGVRRERVPRPLGWVVHESCLDDVAIDVHGCPHEVSTGLDRSTVESIAPDRAGRSSVPVQPAGVVALQPTHPAAQIRAWRADQEVIVRRQDGERPDLPAAIVRDRAEQPEEPVTGSRIREGRRVRMRSARDMVDETLLVYARPAPHAADDRCCARRPPDGRGGHGCLRRGVRGQASGLCRTPDPCGAMPALTGRGLGSRSEP